MDFLSPEPQNVTEAVKAEERGDVSLAEQDDCFKMLADFYDKADKAYTETKKEGATLGDALRAASVK